MVGNWLRRLWNDERGNALILAAGAMPMVIGSAGLATDTVQWALWKRQLQRAADSAALAGAYAKYQNQTVSTAVTNDLLRTNRTGYALTTSSVTEMTATTTETSKVKVKLAFQVKLPFSSFLTSRTETIGAEATAAAVDDGEYCVVALNKVDTDITLQGSMTANLGCGAFANSSNNPYDTNGNTNGSGSGGIHFNASPIAAAGAIADSTVWGSSTIQSYRMPQSDPFSGKYDTTIPASLTCKSTSNHIVATGTTTITVTANNGSTSTQTAVQYTLDPGCYTDFNLSASSAYLLQPGTYYLKNTDFKINSNTYVSGTGVTFVLTGTNASQIGSLSINGTAELHLSAPTGDTDTFKNILFIQSDLVSSNGVSKINGNSNTQFDGAIYFPKTEVEVGGNNSGLTRCAMIVSDTVTFTGNTTIENSASDCNTDNTIPLKVIRLVA